MTRTNLAYFAPGPSLGRLAVTCWCERTVVWLPAERVRAGETVSCRAADCQERSPLPAKGDQGTGDAASPTLKAEPAPVPAITSEASNVRPSSARMAPKTSAPGGASTPPVLVTPSKRGDAMHDKTPRETCPPGRST